jgi:hypothetical protein
MHDQLYQNKIYIWTSIFKLFYNEHLDTMYNPWASLVTKNYGWEILGFGQDHPHLIHGIKKCLLFCYLVIHKKVSKRKPWGGDKLIVNSTRKFKDKYNVCCFILEWRKTTQAVEHGNGTIIRRHCFWKLSICSCFVCDVCVVDVWEFGLYWREECPTVEDGDLLFGG